MTLGAFAVIGALVVAIALGADLLRRTAITVPILAVAVGLAISFVSYDRVAVTAGSEEVLVVAEITLIVLLFSDAARISPAGLKETGSMNTSTRRSSGHVRR